jgi:anti-sigma regulatory factor (Ser/Thr protein kinase)
VAPEDTVAYRPAQEPTAAWPLMSYLELAALPTAVGSARKHARAIALEWGLPTLADNTELIVSELVTNSIQATEHLRSNNLEIPVVRLSLASDLQGILIRVWDPSSQMPIHHNAGPDDDSGRGLMMVSCLASEWGTYRKSNGKVVWVIVR